MVIHILKRVCYFDSNSREPKYKAKLIDTFFIDVIPRKGDVITGINDEAYDVLEVIHQVNKTPGKPSSSSVFIEVEPHNYYSETKTDNVFSLITELKRDTN